MLDRHDGTADHSLDENSSIDDNTPSFDDADDLLDDMK